MTAADEPGTARSATPTQPDFFAVQTRFAGHIRDPKHQSPPAGIEDRRMAIYRELFFNNISTLLETSFPVLRKLLPDGHWRDMIRDFLVHHRCQTPLFLEISQEFLDYLASERQPNPADPPFLLELAHYEWVELALSVSDDEVDASLIDANGDLMAGTPVISPVAWNLSYRFPVHRIGPNFQPGETDVQGPGLPHLTHLL
ncbi:MAG: putative DNA-binding domain-containing protein, partial [Thiohalocapsa sp.]